MALCSNRALHSQNAGLLKVGSFLKVNLTGQSTMGPAPSLDLGPSLLFDQA